MHLVELGQHLSLLAKKKIVQGLPAPLPFRCALSQQLLQLGLLLGGRVLSVLRRPGLSDDLGSAVKDQEQEHERTERAQQHGHERKSCHLKLLAFPPHAAAPGLILRVATGTVADPVRTVSK
jgi:hypothetical protein